MKISARSMVQCSMFAALITVCAWISIPVLDIAFTLQTLGIFLNLSLLGGKRGCAAIFLYLLLGAAGMPVFSGFQGGIGCLAGVTGGFLWGFAAAGLVYRLLERFGKLPAMIAGQLICYVCGCVWFYLYTGGGLWLILVRCIFPFLLPDAVKIALACTLSRRLARHIA